MAKADNYRVYVDWDNDGGLSLSNFENSLDGWYTFGTTPPDLYLKGDFNPSPRAAHLLVDDFTDNDFDSDKWPEFRGATIDDGAADIPCTVLYGFLDTRDLLMVSSYFQAKVTVPNYSTGSREFRFSLQDGSNGNFAHFAWRSTSQTLSLMYQPSPDDFGDSDTETITYNSTTMAYLRFRESEGWLYWETSPDGIVWEVQREILHGFSMNEVSFEFRATNPAGEAASSMQVSEVNTSEWPVYTGRSSLLVDWKGYNPFQFDVSGHGFDQGRFGILDNYNSDTPFTFGDSDLGFGSGRFAYAETEDLTVLSPAVRRDLTGLVVGRSYTAVVHVYLPTTNLSGAVLSVVDMDAQASTSVTGSYQTLSVVFTAQATAHTLQVATLTDAVETDLLWLDQAQFLRTGEEVSDRVLNRTSLSFARGRDSARTLDNNAPATMPLELDNESRDYSPDNTTSPLYGDIGPGKPVLVAATFQGTEYPLFHGYVDDFQIQPFVTDRSVEMTTVDLLGYMGEQTISTELYAGLRTGQAIHKVLDAIEWPVEKRIVDPGATVIPWWWEDGTTASEAVDKIQKSEGPPSICYIDAIGNFVFRDRHHRILTPTSRDVQGNFVMTDDEEASGDGIAYSPDFTYDIGWKDLINSVEFDVDQRQPSPQPTEIYSSDDTLTIVAGQTKEIAVSSTDPFYDAITPVDGTDFDLEGIVTVSLSRTSGGSLTVRLTAGTGGAIIHGMKVRATNVPVTNTVRIAVEEPDSISKFRKKSYNETAPWLNINDALAVANILIGLRSTRLPIVTFTLKNGSRDRLFQILNRNLSDRVHIEEDETFTDHDFFIEKVEHEISESGFYHTAQYSCERVREQVTGVFTFDDPDHGFDDGLFGYVGIDDVNKVFILNQSNLDEGLLGN